MRKKTVFIRIRKEAKNRYRIEERHTFMFFFHFWIKGAIKIKVPKRYINPVIAERAIKTACDKKGLKYLLISLER